MDVGASKNILFDNLGVEVEVLQNVYPIFTNGFIQLSYMHAMLKLNVQTSCQLICQKWPNKKPMQKNRIMNCEAGNT